MENPIKVGITGHRPNKLDGYDISTSYYRNMLETFKDFFVRYNVSEVYSGMALGVDTIAALAVIELKEQCTAIKLVCCIPCLNQDCKWPEKSRQQYRDILSKADKVVQVSELPYTPYLMQLRNMYMVDSTDEMIAVFDGSAGGTKNCVDYAKKQGKPITIYPPHIFREDYKV